MTSTLKGLSAQLRQLADELPIRANRIKQETARVVNFDLLQTTPVDTGQAVSNWQVTNGEPATDPRPAFVPSPEGYMKQADGVKTWTHRGDTEATRQANIQPALKIAEEVIAAATPNEPICITNVLPYIQALDEGHSQQAALFVDRAIILGRDVASRVRITD